MNAIKKLLTLLALSGGAVTAEEIKPSDDLPSALSEGDFSALRTTSPFTRVLSLPETYALRGIATVGGVQVATLFNRETKKTLVVTPEGDNDAGISLVGIVPAATLEGVAAKISFAGDEADLKYELSQIVPQARPISSQEGERKEEPRGPSTQDIERYKALPEEKQAKLREYIGHVMRNYPDMPRDERGNLIRGAMIRLTDCRDLELPPATSQGASSSGSLRPAPTGGSDQRDGGDRSRSDGDSSRGDGR